MSLFLALAFGFSALAANVELTDTDCAAGLEYRLKESGEVFNADRLVQVLRCLAFQQELESSLSSHKVQMNQIPGFEEAARQCAGVPVRSSQIFKMAKKFFGGWSEVLDASQIDVNRYKSTELVYRVEVLGAMEIFNVERMIGLLRCLAIDQGLGQQMRSYAVQNNQVDRFAALAKICVGFELQSSQVFTMAKKLLGGWGPALEAAKISIPSNERTNWRQYSDSDLLLNLKRLIDSAVIRPRADDLRNSPGVTLTFADREAIQVTGLAFFNQLIERWITWRNVMKAAGRERELGTIREADVDFARIKDILMQNGVADLSSSNLIKESERIRHILLMNVNLNLSGQALSEKMSRLLRLHYTRTNITKAIVYLYQAGFNPTESNLTTYSTAALKILRDMDAEIRIRPSPLLRYGIERFGNWDLALASAGLALRSKVHIVFKTWLAQCLSEGGSTSVHDIKKCMAKNPGDWTLEEAMSYIENMASFMGPEN